MAMGMGNESVMPSIQRSTMAWYIHKGCIQEGMLMGRLCVVKSFLLSIKIATMTSVILHEGVWTTTLKCYIIIRNTYSTLLRRQRNVAYSPLITYHTLCLKSEFAYDW